MQEMQKIQIQPLGGEDSPGGENGHPLQYSRCKVPRAEEPDGLHGVVESDMTEHACTQRVGGAASLQLAGFPLGAHSVQDLPKKLLRCPVPLSATAPLHGEADPLTNL